MPGSVLRGSFLSRPKSCSQLSAEFVILLPNHKVFRDRPDRLDAKQKNQREPLTDFFESVRIFPGAGERWFRRRGRFCVGASCPRRSSRTNAVTPRRAGRASASSYGFWPFTEFPEVACSSSCATALATRDPGRNRSNMTLDRDQSRIGADLRAGRPHNLLPNCLDRCSFCAPCLSSSQQQLYQKQLRSI